MTRVIREEDLNKQEEKLHDKRERESFNKRKV
jgi:hypothetical protein